MVVSRRSFVLSGLLIAASGALGDALTGPSADRRPFVLWGSSSAAGGRHQERPPGYPGVRIEALLSQLLGAPGTSEGIGGDVSSQTLSMRSRDHPYKPDLDAGGRPRRLPGMSPVVVPALDGRVPSAHRPIPGTVAGVAWSLQGGRRDGTVVLRRETPGAEVEVGPGAAGWWHTSLEGRHRGAVHLVWTGKNNIEDTGRVLADTRAIWAVEPASTVVMGHWLTGDDRPGTAGWEQVRGVNAAYREEYGQQYYDTMTDLRDPGLWSLPALRPYRIGASAEDRRWLALGLPPRSVVAGDRRHLNALGNTVVAHGLHRHLTGTAGLY